MNAVAYLRELAADIAAHGGLNGTTMAEAVYDGAVCQAAVSAQGYADDAANECNA